MAVIPHDRGSPGGSPDRGAEESGEPPAGWTRLAAASVAVGVCTGLLVAGFRRLLEETEVWRTTVLALLGTHGALGLLSAMLGVAVAAALAAHLVRRYSPSAGGSGIPQVEAVLAGAQPLPPPAILPVKFFGGWLAIGSGLALGREGPSVQMGASLGGLWGRWCRLHRSDAIAVIAAGGGAGLATAFNAPIAGAVLVLEELVRRYDPRVAVAALGASGGAIAVARVFLGQAPDFDVPPIPFSGVNGGLGFLMLGLCCGMLATAYHRILLAALDLADRLQGLPVELRAGLVGAGVGAVGWWAPGWIGGGDPLTQAALGSGLALTGLPLLLGLRFLLSMVSYGAGTPGGLFAPMLTLGALTGLLVGTGLRWLHPDLQTPMSAYALVGMAALFAGVVRAPVTALVLVTELTGNTTLLLPMLAAGFVALLTTGWTGTPAIYDALSQRLAGLDRPVKPASEAP
ncbi:MAG: chloride channel protein [Verrucomicrobia bacterium]|nr:chloride channel protein [Verrucomicrobiota bacterium]